MAVAENRNIKTPDKKLVLLTLISLILVTGGSLGWIKFKQEQDNKIQQAQNVLTQICQSSSTANTILLDDSKKVNEATRILHSVPNFPGLDYQKAQTELNNFSTCIKTAQATENFFTAKELSKKALGINNKTVLSVEAWQAIQSDLTRAIDNLRSIPKDTSIYKESQKELKKYQVKLAEINKRIENEQTAVNSLLIAKKLYKEADEITGNNNLESWKLRESKITDAIQVLEKISSGTTVSDESKETLVLYQQKLGEIKYQIATLELNYLVKQTFDFAALLDTQMEYHEYSSGLNNLKYKFNNIIKESPAINNHPAAQALTKALNHYNDALVIWRYCHEGKCSISISAAVLELREVLLLPSNFAIKGVPLTKKYQVQVGSNLFRQKYIQLDDALTKVWEQAEQDVKDAQANI